MQFFEKLDFLMNITNTSNSALALNIKLDPSHISRLRRGERNALKNEACISAMSAYFARHCEQDYQQKALAEALNLSAFPNDEGKLSSCLAQWLSVKNKNDADMVGSFLSGLVNIKNKQTVAVAAEQGSMTSENQKNETDVFFGISGKRRAVIEFLSDVLAKGKPQTILLFSDEATDWLTDDRDFSARWGFLMSQFLSCGGKIKIIHTVNRDLDEMLSAISQWMPLYMSGSIEPYYYPKKRDGVFKRTLFIAPGVAAVVSSSVGNMAEQAANVLFRDKASVAAFEREICEYLNLCKPLMKIYTAKDEKAYLSTLLDFEKEPSDSIIKTGSLSLLTMPEKVASSILLRNAGMNRSFFDYLRKRTELFEKSIRSSSFTEIIAMHDVETVLTGGIKVALSDMLNADTVYYTADEYISHLENLVVLLETYENFHVILTGSANEDHFMVYVKEDFGALVAKTNAPPVIMSIGENNLKAAFWDYLISITGSESIRFRGRDENLKKLTDYIGRLKKCTMLQRTASAV